MVMKKIIFILVCLLFLTACNSNEMTGEAIKEIKISPDAYLEKDGEAIEIPFEVEKDGEDYCYLLDQEELDSLCPNCKIVDGGKVVYENTIKQKGKFSYKSSDF